ncbi:hypothetical protein [Actinoplanes sp. DH11]|uniref:hypothetical protein n=1 Tax=Actinoplanes sp. DH11 TaxID=2857011 RepID=UPI001E4C5BBC|nr:hypothetical protein [Actinoplanes sp. DH11]
MTTDNRPNPNPNGATGNDAGSHLYHYFVSFNHNTGGNISFANAEISLLQPIRRYEQVVMLQNYYQRELGFANALILGYTLMRTEPVAAPSQKPA